MPTASRLAVITCIWITVVGAWGLIVPRKFYLLDSAKETGFGHLDSANKAV